MTRRDIAKFKLAALYLSTRARSARESVYAEPVVPALHWSVATVALLGPRLADEADRCRSRRFVRGCLRRAAGE